MSKKFDVDKIRSDLAASSLHFQPQSPAAPLNPLLEIHPPLQIVPKIEQPVRSDVRTDVRTDGQKRTRLKTRHPFDIFQDQLQSLRELQFHREKKSGTRPTLGELAQEALDQYITTETKK